MRIINEAYCGECCFFKNEDANGIGACALQGDGLMRCDERCNLNHTEMRREDTAKGLSAYQKWRRGGKGKLPHPYVIGKIIDSAIYKLRHDVVI